MNVQPSKDTAGKGWLRCKPVEQQGLTLGWLTVACLPRDPAESSGHTAATATSA